MGQRKRPRLPRPKYLPEKLLAIRHKLGMSRSQLAKLIVPFDKGAARISEYERGVRRPNILVLLDYAKIAGVCLDILANDNIELSFPRNWKRTQHPEALLMQDRVLLNDMPMEELPRFCVYSVHHDLHD